MSKNNPKIPTYTGLIVPTFKALKDLGGSGTNNEIYEKVIDNEQFTRDILEESHLGSKTQTEVQYQLAWARTYLKDYGAIMNSSKGVWSITSNFSSIEPTELNPTEVISFSHKNNNGKTDSNFSLESSNGNVEYLQSVPEENQQWRSRLSTILQNMDPYAFEKLCQRVLRESGFEDVKVTRKTNDGGIDGTGKLIINGLISFNIVFQCKRYKDKVSSPDIRNFRGSIHTNIEKGIFITTGMFTDEAKKEACSPGKLQIDLVDGERFMDILASNGLGVEEIKTYTINEDFFNKI